MEKTIELYVLPALIECYYATMSFDLWMFKRGYDVFTLVVNFLSSNLQLKHVIIGLFEAIKTIGQALAKKFDIIVGQVWFKEENIIYVKDEGFHFNEMISALKSIINCEYLGIKESFQGTCFVHAFSKAFQYGIVEEKICRYLKYVSIKSTQTYF